MGFESFEAKVDETLEDAAKRLENAAIIVMALGQNGDWCIKWSQNAPPIVLIGLAESGKLSIASKTLKSSI